MLAASRIMLGLHTVLEIAVAFAIGALCLVVFGIRLTGGQPTMLNAGQVIALLLLIGVAHSSHIDGEVLIRRLFQKIGTLRGEDANVIGELTSGQIRCDSALMLRSDKPLYATLWHR